VKARSYNPDIWEPYATPEERYRDSLELEDERRRCSFCDSTEVDILEYDHGACRETGYQDRGERVVCRQCGETEERDG
jgi:hypothetical protein